MTLYPYKAYSFKPKPKGHNCFECGTTFTSGEELRTHLVEVHNYRKEGNVVYKRRPCSYGECGKPGLYTVGPTAACKEHLSKLKLLQVKQLVSYDKGVAGPVEAHIKEREDYQRRKDSAKAQHARLRG